MSAGERRDALRPTLTRSAYAEEAGWEADRARTFAGAWHPLPPELLHASPGSARPFTLLPSFLDEPLLLTRDGGGEWRALSNACTHRGALVCPEAIQTRELRCPYHGRRFGLDGRLRAAPGFEDAPSFPRAEDDLPHAALATLGPLRLLALTPGLAAAQWGAAAHERFDALGWSEFVHDSSGTREFPLQAHWALYVENYLEGFHVPYVHPALARALDLSRYATMTVAHGVLQIAAARADEPAIEPPPGHPDHGRRVAAWYLWLFPNVMLNLYPWGLSVNVVEPRGPQASVVRYHRFLRDARLLERGAGAGLDQVEREDQAVVESVQRGLRGRLWRGGVLAPQHEHGLARMHELWAQARAASEPTGN